MGDGMNETPPKPRRPFGLYFVAAWLVLFPIVFAVGSSPDLSPIHLHVTRESLIGFLLWCSLYWIPLGAAIGVFLRAQLGRWLAIIWCSGIALFLALAIYPMMFFSNLGLALLWQWPFLIFILSYLAVLYFLYLDKATVGAFRNAGRKAIGDGH